MVAFNIQGIKLYFVQLQFLQHKMDIWFSVLCFTLIPATQLNVTELSLNYSAVARVRGNNKVY
jgi:hypothetical protein